MLILLQALLLIATVASMLYYFACILFTRQFFATTQPTAVVAAQPVSVLVPVCGLEEDARQNWTALCQQDYGEYEVLFGVKDADDPAVPVLQELTGQFSQRARLILCQEVRGSNYKTSNTMQLLETARYDWVIFADSDIRVLPHYLKTVVTPLADPAIGAVTCAYVSRKPRDLGAAIASLGRCIDFIPSVLVARHFYQGLRFALGATVATRKTVLSQLPELKTLVNRAGDDYHIGRMIADAGYRVELSEYLVDIDITYEPLERVFQRELRWSRVIFRNRGPQYYGLAIAYGPVYSLLLLLLSQSSWAAVVCLSALSLRGIQAVSAIYSLQCPKLIYWLWTLPLRDLLSFSVWLLGVSGNRILWRGRQLEVKPGGFINEPVEVSSGVR